MQYCDKFYEVARPLYDAIQKIFETAYLQGSVQTKYGLIPKNIYTTGNSYTDEALDALGVIHEFFGEEDFGEPLPWYLPVADDKVVKGGIKWEY